MCTLCDSTNINTIIEFVPNCLYHVSGDGFNGGSDSYLQFWDIYGKRRNIILILDATPQKEITWGFIWRTRWQVVKTPTIVSNNPVYIFIYILLSLSNQCLVVGFFTDKHHKHKSPLADQCNHYHLMKIHINPL